MTVSSETQKNTYSGDGATTAFAFSFPILDETHLLVQIKDENDAYTTKILTTDYTISGTGNESGLTNYSSGTVTFGAGDIPAATDTVIISRDVPLTQATDYVENDPFPAETHERSLDKLTMIDIQQQEVLDRTVRIDSGVSDTLGEISTLTADAYLKRNSDNDGWEFSTLSATAGLGNVVEDLTPQLGGQLDVNGQALGDGTLELLKFSETASAINEITISNAATGNGPKLAASGDDANVDLNLQAKAAGLVAVVDGADATKKIKLDSSGATTATATTIAAAQTADRTITLPNATCTLVGKDTTDTLTNKTFNANGTGNSLSNVDVADLSAGTDGSLITWDTDGNPTTIAPGTSGYVLTSAGAGAVPTWSAAGTKPQKEITWLPGSFESNSSTPAALQFLNGTNVDTMIRAFDDTTQEYVEGKFMVPGDVNTGGTVTFRVYCMAATADATNRNVEFTFDHLALNSAEDFDPASPYTSEVSGDIDTGTTQDNVIEATWTETITNLGWAANDLVIFRLSRTDPSATELVGDAYLFSFTIEIPRT